ncbi:MAG TPA: GDSL-type esterase/lipase family protein [Xanthobacteraceae bacterium]|nr:GDSL-type esterase/lipase family protein [Xanthobacteraceae bacterium]
MPTRRVVVQTGLAALAFAPALASAQPGRKWVTAWAASAQGPYPAGYPLAQPDLRFAFPAAETGARDQTFRLMVTPDIWGRAVRLRLSNAFGTKPVAFDGVFVGLQLASAAVLPGSRRPVAFGGKQTVTVAPGQSVWSDPAAISFVKGNGAELAGRRLAVSFHVVGESGPMTWHAKALTTSYVSAPDAGGKGAVDEEAFPFSTASWYFLDAVDMMVPADTRLIVAFGDSITDGTASTINGEDRWPNVLSRRLHALGKNVAVVNAGIGGNQVIGPAEYSPQQPFAGGPAAGQRLERDVLGLSGLSAVIWLEGINDLSRNGNASVEAVAAGMKEIVGRIRARAPGVRVIGATLTSALGSTNAAYGFAELDDKRKALNEFISGSGLFDGVADFDKATIDPQTGSLKAQFIPESATGGAGDKIHPNRAGYLAMGEAIDLDLLAPAPTRGGRR